MIPMAISAFLLVFVSSDRSIQECKYLPEHIYPHKRIRPIGRRPREDNQHQSNNTRYHGQSARAQDRHHPHFLPKRHLQLHRQRQRERQHDQIADYADHGVGHNDSRFIETGPVRGRDPEFLDRGTDSDLDDHRGYVVGQHEDHEQVDEDHGLAVRLEYSGHDPEEGDFGEECGRAVHYHCYVDGLQSVRLSLCMPTVRWYIYLLERDAIAHWDVLDMETPSVTSHCSSY